jgi:cytochrome P450
VWLERYEVWASARHAEVQAALTDWEAFSSAAGVGIDDFRKAKPWRPPSLILEVDPPLHTRSRTVLNRALSAKAMAGLRARFKDAAERLADEVVARRRVDGIADIAEAYPLSVFPQAVGLGSEGLENLLPYGTMVFKDPALVRPSLDEILRWESPVQAFFRTTTKLVKLDGVTLPADAKVLLFFAGANRDPRRWEEPYRFDIRRRAAGHVAFGAGIHMCVGQMLARLESEMVLAALLSRVARIEIAGEPKRKLNNTLRQFSSLPIELTPA